MTLSAFGPYWKSEGGEVMQERGYHTRHWHVGQNVGEVCDDDAASQ